MDDGENTVSLMMWSGVVFEVVLCTVAREYGP